MKNSEINIRPGNSWQVITGHAYGLRGSVIVGQIHWPQLNIWNNNAIKNLLLRKTGLTESRIDACLADGFNLEALLRFIKSLEVLEQLPVMQKGIQLKTESDESKASICYTVAIPTYHSRFTISLLSWLLNELNVSQADHGNASRNDSTINSHPALSGIRKSIRKYLGAGVNNLRIANAANQLNLPFCWLPDGLLHLGSGRNAKYFQSTITEATPNIGVSIAKRKSVTANILRRHGLPTTRHYVVTDLDSAVAAAKILGYPIVIKPDDRDGGTGVYAGLKNENQLRECFLLSKKSSNRLLIEKHVYGKDYRITIANGQVVKAICRVPGGVLGDGKSTIRQLLELNSTKSSLNPAFKSLVTLDEEAISLLKESGRTPDDVLIEDEFVQLRRRANMSTGGTSHDVIDLMHPDNARLALLATEALRLDIAGVDLLIPDIRESWQKSQAAICEVNAQPQISTQFASDIYLNILRKAIVSPTRLRSALIICFDEMSHLDSYISEISATLRLQGETVLSVRSDGIWLDEERIGNVESDNFNSATNAEFNRQATAVIAAMTSKQIIEKGLPWLFIDHACVFGYRTINNSHLKQFMTIVPILKPHLTGNLYVDSRIENISNNYFYDALVPHLRMDGRGLPDHDWVRDETPIKIPNFATESQ